MLRSSESPETSGSTCRAIESRFVRGELLGRLSRGMDTTFIESSWSTLKTYMQYLWKPFGVERSSLTKTAMTYLSRPIVLQVRFCWRRHLPTTNKCESQNKKVQCSAAQMSSCVYAPTFGGHFSCLLVPKPSLCRYPVAGDGAAQSEVCVLVL